MSTVNFPLRFTWFQPRHLRLMALCGVVCCGVQAQDTAKIVQMVDVDGYQVRVQLAGLASRKAGSPVIVLEAGLTNSLEVWDPVFSQLASAAPVVAYDRAGLGRSAWDNNTPTPQHVTSRLHRMLREMAVEPPYLVAGYSWGGVLMRYFAGYYPADVAGIVYIDPGPIITQTRADELAPFDSVGAGREGYEAYWSAFAAIMERRSAGAKAEFNAMRKLLELDIADRDLKPVPDVPVVVLVSAKPFPPFFKVPYDQDAHYRVDLRHRIRMLKPWALRSSRGTFVVSNHSTHAVPREDPELIVWAVKRVLGAIER